MKKYYPMEQMIYYHNLSHLLAKQFTFTIGKRRAGLYEFMKFYSAIWETKLVDGSTVEKAKKTHLVK